jgi:dihydrofolate reductase/thymidylate synthase
MNIIVAVDKRLGIGKDGGIPWNIKDDLKYFRDTTKGHIVVMGRVTWDSIGQKPLPGRYNVVITHNGEVYNGDKYMMVPLSKAYTFLDDQVAKGKRVFVIGGDSIYSSFIDRVDTMYLTHIDKDFKCDTFFSSIDRFHIRDYGVLRYDDQEQCSFRMLTYSKNAYMSKHDENAYLGLIKDIMVNGNFREERTGVGAYSVFARQLRFDISRYLPLLTTKFVSHKAIINELLWFLRGQTDSKILEAQGINIWRGNTSKAFIEKTGLPYEEGDCGPMYGFNLLHFGAKYRGCKEDYGSEGVNQLEEAIGLLKRDPFSRRILMTTYNVTDRHNGVLYPCHGLVIQFFCEQDKEGVQHLSCHMYQRSSDSFLGLPFNIASYAILTHIIAKKVDMKPKELVVSTGDTHIYKNHEQQVNIQLSRKPYPFPCLDIDDSVKDKDWSAITQDDIRVVGYFYHPTIKGDMAV